MNRCSKRLLLLALFLSSTMDPLTAQPQDRSLTITVIAPPSTPEDTRLVVAGGDSMWGNWNPAEGIPLSRESDSVWSVTRRVPKGYALEFKITRGSWDTEALYEPGQRPPNLSVLVEEDSVVTLRPVGWADGILGHTPSVRTNDIVGTVRYHRAMKSTHLHHSRDIIVWLPSSYPQEPGKRYPVLYMQDGQNIVDPRTSSFGYDWRVDEVADSLTRAGVIEEIIIVGIYNSPDRSQEYSNTGAGSRYAKFVIETLKPFIDSTYRTKPEPSHTAVMGSSSGGLISFLFVWWHPDIFSRAACLSGNFSEDAGDILEEVRAYDGPTKKIRVYLDMGSKGVDRRLRAGCETLFTLLKTKGYKEGRDVVYHYYDGADHNEQAWAARVWRPLTFLFGDSSF